MNTFITYKNLLSIKFILLLCGSIIFIIKNGECISGKT